MQAVISIPDAAAWSGGGLIFAGFLVVFFFAFAYGYYTRMGSAINQHPYADLDHNSGPEKPSELAHDLTQDVRNWTAELPVFTTTGIDRFRTPDWQEFGRRRLARRRR